MMMQPMPSPRGTNKAQLFIPTGFFRDLAPAAAYDSKSPCAHGECRSHPGRLAYDKLDEAFDKGKMQMVKQVTRADVLVRRAVRRAMYAQGTKFGLAYDAARSRICRPDYAQARALEQRRADRREAAAPGKARLVDPDQPAR
jgi:hypothetical protein